MRELFDDIDFAVLEWLNKPLYGVDDKYERRQIKLLYDIDFAVLAW